MQTPSVIQSQVTPAISVITPTRLIPSRLLWLEELHESLALAAGEASFEHIIVLDGADEANVPVGLRDSANAKIISLPTSVGAAAARNIGLVASAGIYITSADDDDLIPGGTLQQRATILESNRNLGWVGGLIEDVDSEGIRLGVWDCPAQRGHNDPGDVFRTWTSPASTFPLGPTTLLVRADLLRAVGGWGGLPQGEDLSMVMAVTTPAAGFMIDAPVYRYRKHLEQMTKGAGFNDLELLVRKASYARASSIQALEAAGREPSLPHPV